MTTKKDTEKVIITENDLKEIKMEILDYAKEGIDGRINELVKEADKKIIKEKNRVIIKRDIIIVILLALAVYLLYIVYSAGAFDKYFNHTNPIVTKETIEEDNIPTEEQPEIEEENLDKLKEQYSYLIDNIKLDAASEYLDDFYKGNLTEELKMSLAISNIDAKEVTYEENIAIIKSEMLKTEYDKLFYSNDFENKTFNYNGRNVKYLKSTDFYMIEINNENEIKPITKEIIDIDKNDTLEITTIEGLVDNKKVYNPITNKELGEYNSDLTKYQDKLIKIKYIFKEKEGTLLLSSIEPISE